MLKKRYHVAVATAALALLLAGCSGGSGGASSEGPKNETQQSSVPPAAADQSKADACKIVQDGLTEFSTLSSEMDPSNPQGVLDKFKELSTKTSDSLASITNAEVKPAATKAATALGDYVTFLEAVIADPSKASDMTEKVTALQEGFTEVGTVCAS